MTAFDELPPSRRLAFNIDRQLVEIGMRASEAADQVFQRLEADGWHYDYGPEYSEPFSQSIGERLEHMAGQAIYEELSNAVLAYWLQQRRACQVECTTEESIGGLFTGLAAVVGELIHRALNKTGATLVTPTTEQTEASEVVA